MDATSFASASPDALTPLPPGSRGALWVTHSRDLPRRIPEAWLMPLPSREAAAPFGQRQSRSLLSAGRLTRSLPLSLPLRVP
jgi:hypothetical protein